MKNSETWHGFSVQTPGSWTKSRQKMSKKLSVDSFEILLIVPYCRKSFYLFYFQCCRTVPFLTAVAKSNPSFTASGASPYPIKILAFFSSALQVHSISNYHTEYALQQLGGSQIHCLQFVVSIFPIMSSSF